MSDSERERAQKRGIMKKCWNVWEAVRHVISCSAAEGETRAKIGESDRSALSAISMYSLGCKYGGDEYVSVAGWESELKYAAAFLIFNRGRIFEKVTC